MTRTAVFGTVSRLLALGLLALACGGEDLPVGEIEGGRRPADAVARAEQATADAADAIAARAEVAAPQERILFGDLHVHTTYSIDAFLYNLPLFAGEGAHPPADACDFARHCSALDFFSLNDHAEGLTPERWRRSIESIRECNARAGDPADPDIVAYMGWEWTQTGATPETHFGHKNVVVPGLADDEIPPRPISALPNDVMDRAPPLWILRAVEAAASLGFSEYANFLWWVRRLAEVPLCQPGVDTRELPADCHENAPTPEVLFEKLGQWGGEYLVIPHGLAWGIHAPPGARLDVQLARGRLAPDHQRLLEVYSGHGSSEVFDPVAARFEAAQQAGVCPEPSPDFLPCCWQAGEIIRARCDEPDSEDCESRVVEARSYALAAGRRPHWVIPDASAADWLDCDQLRGAFKPAMTTRPGMSAQYALAVSDFTETDPAGRPRRFHFGLIGSSDIHSARAGTGYKQVQRKGMTDARGFASPGIERRLQRFVRGEQEEPVRAQPAQPAGSGFRGLLDVERGASFLYPGGLVAVHAAARDRRSVWDALVRREVYGTSGPRILLWFDLVNPAFEVRAVGSFVQRPGCPPESLAALSAERIESLCLGECYYPSDERHPIVTIEVVRIRPQQSADEPVAELVEDPWLRFDCPPDPEGCVVRFEDPDFAESGRAAVYYARALQESTPGINAGTLRTRYDDSGRALSVDPCYGGYRTARDDDCLAPVQERAWSSPIFIEPAQGSP
jgi:hypothetical protein